MNTDPVQSTTAPIINNLMAQTLALYDAGVNDGVTLALEVLKKVAERRPEQAEFLRSVGATVIATHDMFKETAQQGDQEDYPW